MEVDSGTTFRARWRDQLSNTILHKTPILGFYPVKIPKRRAWKVVVNPTPLYMKLGGKPVILQRFRAGKWERFRSAPLVLKANYELRRRDELRGGLRHSHARHAGSRHRADQDRCAMLLRQDESGVAHVRLLAGGLAGLAVAAGVASAASQPATRIVDRTMLCKTWGSGYPDPLRTMAVVGVPNQAQATNGPEGSPRFVVAQIALGVNGQDQVVVSRAACAPTSKRLQLSAKGLRSGETDFGNKWKCPVPASVLIRVRAAFARPVTLEPAPDASYLLDCHGTNLERLAGHRRRRTGLHRLRIRRQGRRGRDLRRQAPLPAEPFLTAATFPLIPRRRVLGLPFGALHSARRGLGSDVAGSRPYQPGDDIDRIDWYASARLSLARGSDEFVVREHFAEEAPRVVSLVDRRPSMSIFPEGWPWLQKPEAIRGAVRLISDSAIAARGLLGYLDEGEGEPFWHPPRSQHLLGDADLERPFEAPADTLVRSLHHLVAQRRDLPAGTFVFVISDFLEPPTRDDWLLVLERRFEIVPVIVQDPIWEQSFPDVSGAAVPFADAPPAASHWPRCASTRRPSGASRTRRASASSSASSTGWRWTLWSSRRTSTVTSSSPSSPGPTSEC